MNYVINVIDDSTTYSESAMEALRLESAYKYMIKALKEKNDKYIEKAIGKLKKVNPYTLESMIEGYLFDIPAYKGRSSTETISMKKQDIELLESYMALYKLVGEAQPNVKEVIDKKLEKYQKELEKIKGGLKA